MNYDKLMEYEREKRYPNIKVVKHLIKERRPRRNAKCPCGSGLRFKQCCQFMEKQNQVDRVLAEMDRIAREKENKKKGVVEL